MKLTVTYRLVSPLDGGYHIVKDEIPQDIVDRARDARDLKHLYLKRLGYETNWIYNWSIEEEDEA